MAASTILIVEDDDSIREVLRMALELEGYATLTAPNGKVALEVLRSSPPPCLVILDLMMPVMDGWQFARQVESDADLSRIPIAVVTAFSDKIGEIRANQILKKPVDMDVLLRAVQQYCGGR